MSDPWLVDLAAAERADPAAGVRRRLALLLLLGHRLAWWRVGAAGRRAWRWQRRGTAWLVAAYRLWPPLGR